MARDHPGRRIGHVWMLNDEHRFLPLNPLLRAHSHRSAQHEDAKFLPPSSSCPSCKPSHNSNEPAWSPPLSQSHLLYFIHKVSGRRCNPATAFILPDYSRILFESGATRVIPHRFSAAALVVLTAHSISLRFHVSGLGSAFQHDFDYISGASGGYRLSHGFSCLPPNKQHTSSTSPQ